MPSFSKPLLAVCFALFSKALGVPIPTGILDEVAWTKCGDMWCGDLYFCTGLWGTLTATPQPITATSGYAYAYRTSPNVPCIPGASPIIRVQAGQTYKLVLHNEAPMDPKFVDPLSALGLNMTTAWTPLMDPLMPVAGFAYWGNMNQPLHTTNLHIHGSHISGMGDHDNVLRPVFPGECQTYIYPIRADNPGGMHIYHPHAHGKVAWQFLGGAFGPFIIEDFNSLGASNGIGKDLNGAPVDLPVKNFLSLRPLERVLAAYTEFGVNMGNGVDSRLYGGAPTTIDAGVWYRFRVLHAMAEGIQGWTTIMDNMGVQMTAADPLGCEVYELANDGVYLSTVPYQPFGTPQFAFLVHGAERLELAVRCAAPGTFQIWYQAGAVATVTVNPTPAVNLYPETVASPFAAGGTLQWNPARPYWLSELRQGFAGYPAAVGRVVKQKIKVSFAGFNGVLFDVAWAAKTPIFAATHTNATIYEMSFFNTNIHPTHMHLQHVQVVTPGGCGALKYGEFYDTVSALLPGTCKVRTRFIDFSGPVIMHCHVLDHEDMGVLGWIDLPYPAPGSFEATPAFSNNFTTYGCCRPQVDAKGAVICRGVPQCGGTMGLDSCNQPCTVPLSFCPAATPFCSFTGVCFAAKSANGQLVVDGAAECSSPVYPYVIMAIGLAIGAVAVVSAVVIVRARSARYDTVLIEEMKKEETLAPLPSRIVSPFQTR